MECCGRPSPASLGGDGTGGGVLRPALDGPGRNRDCCGQPSPPSTGVGGTGGGLLRPSPASTGHGRDRRRGGSALTGLEGHGRGRRRPVVLRPALAALDGRGRDLWLGTSAGPRRPWLTCAISRLNLYVSSAISRQSLYVSWLPAYPVVAAS